LRTVTFIEESGFFQTLCMFIIFGLSVNIVHCAFMQDLREQNRFPRKPTQMK